MSKLTDACYMGHQRTPENTRIKKQVSKTGKVYVARVCKICARRNQKWERRGL